MAENLRKALLLNEKLHVLFVPKLCQIYQINLTNFPNYVWQGFQIKSEHIYKITLTNLSN